MKEWGHVGNVEHRAPLRASWQAWLQMLGVFFGFFNTNMHQKKKKKRGEEEDGEIQQGLVASDSTV